MGNLPKSGQKLGRFLIKRKLGASASGVVYQALDTVLDEPLALKIFSPALAEDALFKAISREIMLTRRISHPGVCRIHDLHEEQDHRFLTMDYIKGPTLQALLRKNRKRGLPITRAVRIMGSAAEAVAAAHKEQITHRNLKPSNIIVSEDDMATVLDFGQACGQGMGGRTALRVDQADLAYSAQEVLFGNPASAASDQYSLGSMMYECVTGVSVLQSMGPVNETSGFRGSQPDDPSKYNHQVTRELSQVIMTAIAANPESRFRSVQDFTSELLDCLDDLSVRSRRPRRVATTSRGSSLVDDAKDDEQAMADRMEQTTLLFSDIVEITSFFDSYGDVAGRQRIDQHNGLLFPVVRRNGGKVLKTIGDAIMASFPDEDEAVEAAIQMQQSLDRFNDQQRREQDRIQIRIGINTGEAIVEYGDAYGDAVNVAARVCSKADGDQILISQDTYDRLVRNRDIINAHSEVTLKGKREVFRLFQVDWLLAEDLVAETAEPPPDLSADDDDQRSDVEPTAIVAAGQGPRKMGQAPDSLLDRLFDWLGMERNSQTTMVLVLVALTFVILVFGLFFVMCGNGPEVVIHGQPPPGPTGQPGL